MHMHANVIPYVFVSICDVDSGAVSAVRVNGDIILSFNVLAVSEISRLINNNN